MIRAKQGLDIRPKISGDLAKAIHRYATAHGISATAAVNLLLSQKMRELNFHTAKTENP